VGIVDVAREHASGKTHARVVRARDQRVEEVGLAVVVGEDGHDRAEDFFARDEHVVCAVCEDGGLDPVAVGVGAGGEGRGAGAAVEELGFVVVDAVVDERGDLLPVGFADERAEVGGWVHDGAGADGGHLLEEAGLEGGLQALGDEDAGAVGADLAGGEEVGHHGAIDGVFELGVGQNDAGRFATELHGHVLHTSSGGGGDLAAGRDLAGERDLGDAGVGGEHGTHVAGTLHDVEDTSRHAGFCVDFGQLEGVEGSEFGGLVNHAVAGGEAGSRLPQGDLDGVVPGTNSGTDTERRFSGVEPGIWAELSCLAVQATSSDHVGVVLEDVGTGDDIDSAGFGERLASISGLDLGELIVAFAEEGDSSEKDTRTLNGGCGGP